MGVTDRGLYVGTQDFSYVANKLTTLAISLDGNELDMPPIADQIAGTQRSATVAYGADLMKFTSLRKPAISISRSGVGNITNYGIRTMVAEPDRLYLGTANPMNLLPRGGWELRRIGPALTLELGARKQELGKKLRSSATASADSTLVAKGKAIKKTAKKLAASQKTKVTVKLKPAERKRLANQLDRKGKARVTVKGTVSTRSGATATDKIKITLKE